MAHNLNYNSKAEKHSFFSVKEKALICAMTLRKLV